MKRSTKIRIRHRGASMLFYPAALPLSSQTLNYTAGVIRRHRQKIGSPWRKLNPGRQALLVLAYLRKGETFAELAAGFGVGTATAWRYISETVTLLAARSPKLRRALAQAKDAGYAYVVIDGTLIPIDRVAADRPFYSGKHRRHGMNLQVISAPDGGIVWVSGPLPGAVHDLTAARIWGILRELAASGLVVLADKGYHGAGDHIRVPYRGRNKPAPQRTPTARTPSYARPANAPTPSSRPGASCANSAAAPGAPDNWPKPSTSCKSARPRGEKLKVGSGHVRPGTPGDRGPVA
jgi:DDE superfamily endonuclease/Helix-turn-helix of DDE superfamily endonuclease